VNAKLEKEMEDIKEKLEKQI